MERVGGGRTQRSCAWRQRQWGWRNEEAAGEAGWRKQTRAVAEGDDAGTGSEREGEGKKKNEEGHEEGRDGIAEGKRDDAGGSLRKTAWTARSVTSPHVRHHRRGLSGPATAARSGPRPS